MNAERAADGRSVHGRSARSDDAPQGARSRAAGGFPAPRGGGRGVGAPEDGLRVLRPYYPPSWFHPVGIHKVLARLEPRLPDVGGKLFLTFTFNPALFAGPLDAFDQGRDRLRRVFYRLRHGVMWEGKRHVVDAPYCIKLEFHENDWAHFHSVFLTKRFLPADLLTDLWGLGRTNVGRIKRDEFRYLLKYVTKAGELPEWIKPRSRVRVFQSSRGFLKPAEGKTATPDAAKVPTAGSRRTVSTLGDRVERWRTQALFQDGQHMQQVQLRAPFGELLADHVFPAAEEGRYLGNGHILINDVSQLIEWL